MEDYYAEYEVLRPGPAATQPIDQRALLSGLLESAPADVDEWGPQLLEHVRSVCGSLLDRGGR